MAFGLVPSLHLQSVAMIQQDQVNACDHLLQNTITNAAYDFLRASPDLHEAAVLTAKKYLDPLAISISDAQVARLQAARKKRKRGEINAQQDVLRLKQLYVQDFSTEQIWEQSKRILDAAARETQLIVGELHLTNGESSPLKMSSFEDDGTASDVDGDRSKYIEDEEDLGINDSDAELEPDEALEDADDNEDIEDGSDIEQDEDMNGSDEDDEDAGQQSKSIFTKDKHGLNDGFFSIDDFNRATEFLEQVDARGDADDGAASDEEDVDWGTDPMKQPLSDDQIGKKARINSVEDDDGPTFGDVDLNAPWSDDDNEDEDIDMDDVDDGNTNEIFYKDFFAPPPRALTKTKRRRALPKTQPMEAQEDDIQRTISAVHRDIFSDDDIDGSEASAEGHGKNLSTHEKRQKALAEQIRQLEAEAVAKRQWTMVGEARAADRPVNSLLEDDLVLDFERTGKPVPEATQATTEAIEDLIKARILNRNFDDIPKRRGGLEVGGTAQGRRGLAELDDRKNPQSLAELYEKEHLKATDPNYVDTRDAETKKAHAEIEGLWKSVSAKLDALCSWHYRPKPVDMEVRVVTDAPRVQMEDARPAGVGVGAEESGLAPQEVYRVGEELNGKKGDSDVVLTSGGAIVARAELTREEKLRRRRREKERIKKKGQDLTRPGSAQTQGQSDAKGLRAPAKQNKKASEKKNILEELKRGNVKVIGKGGTVQDVEGNKAQLGAATGRSAGGVKL